MLYQVTINYKDFSCGWRCVLLCFTGRIHNGVYKIKFPFLILNTKTREIFKFIFNTKTREQFTFIFNTKTKENFKFILIWRQGNISNLFLIRRRIKNFKFILIWRQGKISNLFSIRRRGKFSNLFSIRRQGKFSNLFLIRRHGKISNLFLIRRQGKISNLFLIRRQGNFLIYLFSRTEYRICLMYIKAMLNIIRHDTLNQSFQVHSLLRL